jgi:chromosome partitioning protein
MIVSLVNQKGGVGKTTVAVNLAGSLSDKGARVLILDADPQGSITQWRSISDRRDLEVRHHPLPLAKGDVKAFFQGFDHVVIDSPPAMGEITASVLLVSHGAIVPVGPSPLDIWSSRETVSLIQEARRINRKLRGMLLICRKIPRTKVGREAREAMGIYPLEVLESEICQRVAYIEAMMSGLCVSQYAPGSEAAAEMEGLCLEVIKRMEG